MLKNCGMRKQLFLFYLLDLYVILANQDPPTLRPGNLDLHTKIPESAPARAVVHIYPVCAHFVLVGAGALLPISPHSNYITKLNYVFLLKCVRLIP